MDSNSEFEGRIDYLELLIMTLKEHEKKLSEAVDTLKDTAANLKETTQITPYPLQKTTTITIQCEDWNEFKTKSRKARVIAFSTRDNYFSVTMVSDELYAYSEPLPEQELAVKKEGVKYVVDNMSFNNIEAIPLAFKKHLNCGLQGSIRTVKHVLPDGSYLLKLTFNIDVNQIKSWLSEELNAPMDKILEGKITC